MHDEDRTILRSTKPDRKPEEGRRRTPGFKQWESRKGDRVLVCEFRDNQRLGAGVDVQLFEDGEILV